MIADWVRDYLSCNLSDNRNRMCSWLTLKLPYAGLVEQADTTGLNPVAVRRMSANLIVSTT